MISAEAWKDRQVESALMDLSEQTDANLIIGMEALVASEGTLNRYNSAVFIEDVTGVTGRYDKLHRVPFGEYTPFSGTFPALNRLLPFGGPVPISAGKNAHVFSADGFRMMPLICFEDTVPHLTRSLVAKTRSEGRDVDCFVNLTNDGWFDGSSEQEQHLITASFRCIETRTPMVRAVNTGISAFIDGDGLIRDPEVFIDFDRLQSESGRSSVRTGVRDKETGRYHKQLNAALVSSVPLDARSSMYVKWGDWFAALCCAICLVLIASQKFPRLVPMAQEAC
jgi:apolipoprotein N-acyltransferase